jgi:hypothetical protein
MWEALEHVHWVVVLGSTGWMYELVSVIHYFSTFFFIGTIMLVDLRILGIADRNQVISQLVDQLVPWTWIGFGFSIVSGFLEFATDAGDYSTVNPFRVKMLVILLGVIFALIVQWNVPKWNRLPVIPVGAKILASISLLLWIGSILAATELPALTGLG